MADSLATVLAQPSPGVRTRIKHIVIVWPTELDGSPKVPPWGTGTYPTYGTTTTITEYVAGWRVHVSEDALTSLELSLPKDQAASISYNDVVTIERRWTAGSYDTGWVMIGWGLVSAIADADPLARLICYGPLTLLKNSNFTGTLAGDKIEESNKTLTEILGSTPGDPAYEFVDGTLADHSFNWAKAPPPKIKALTDSKVVVADELQVLHGEGIVRINTEYYEDEMEAGGVKATYHRYATADDTGYDANLVVATLTSESRLKDLLLAAGFQTQSSAAPFYLVSLPDLTTPVYMPPLYYRLDEGRSCYDVYRDLQKFLPPNFRLMETQEGGLEGLLLEQGATADYSLQEPCSEPRRDRDASDLYTAVLVKGYSHTAGDRSNLAWKAGGATIEALHSALANGFSGYADEKIVNGATKIWNLIDGTGDHNCRWEGGWTLAGTETGDPFEDVELFKVDLLESHSIEQILIQGGSKTVGPHGTLTLAIYASTDGSAWTLIADAVQPGEVPPDGGEALLLDSGDFVTEGPVDARYLKVVCLQSWQHVLGLDNETDRWQVWSFSGKKLLAKIELREFEVFGSPLLEAQAILGTTSPYDTAADKALAARLGRRWFIVPDTYYGLDQSKDIEDQEADLEAYAALWLGELKREFAPYQVSCLHQAIRLGDTVEAGDVTGVVVEYELGGDDDAKAEVVMVDYEVAS